jgi:hypothetical protein
MARCDPDGSLMADGAAEVASVRGEDEHRNTVLRPHVHQRESAFQQARNAGDEHRATPSDRRASGERHTAILGGDRHALKVGIRLHRLRE